MPHRPSMACLTALNASVLAVLAAGALLGRYLPPGPFAHGSGLGEKLRAFDGNGYHRIAEHGYEWHPEFAGQFGHGQTIALFPASPLIEAALSHLSGSPWVMIAVGLAFGVWSNIVFAKLAWRLLPPAAALWSTLYLAFWPANCFLLMDYPVGLLNLCAAACLWNRIEGRRLQSVLWCGLGTAASPTMVFIAAAICVDLALTWARTGRTVRDAALALGQAALSVAGLLGFMLYQALIFHDPFAFVTAQSSFTHSPPPLAHLERLFDPSWYLMPLEYTRLTVAALWHGQALATPQGREMLDTAWQLDLDLLALIMSVILLWRAAIKFADPVLALSGWFLLLGYLWFVGTGTFHLLCALRMLYPALVVFLMLGAAAAANSLLKSTILAALSAASLIAAALIAGGYGII